MMGEKWPKESIIWHWGKKMMDPHEYYGQKKPEATIRGSKGGRGRNFSKEIGQKKKKVEKEEKDGTGTPHCGPSKSAIMQMSKAEEERE